MRKKSLGLCAWCGLPAIPDRVLCADCAVKSSNKQKSLVAAKRVRGECRQCPELAVKGRTLCSEHLSKNVATTTKRRMDKLVRLTTSLRNRLRCALINNQKAGSAVRDLGCTVEELKKHLEAKFYDHPKTGEKMTWENWSLSGWHVDHIKPLIGFDLSKREELLQACHYTNLQPLWAEYNLSWGGRPKENEES